MMRIIKKKVHGIKTRGANSHKTQELFQTNEKTSPQQVRIQIMKIKAHISTERTSEAFIKSRLNYSFAPLVKMSSDIRKEEKKRLWLLQRLVPKIIIGNLRSYGYSRKRRKKKKTQHKKTGRFSVDVSRGRYSTG